MPRTDVAVVRRKNDPNAPIAGMPIIEVREAQEVIVIKRSLSPAFAGSDNDLSTRTPSMLFSDAKPAAAEIAAEIERL